MAGFETPDAMLAGGGIQVTGNHPGKARSADELRMDFEKALSLVPGDHRINLHAIYAEFKGRRVDRNEAEGDYFARLALMEQTKSMPWGADMGYLLHAA